MASLVPGALGLVRLQALPPEQPPVVAQLHGQPSDLVPPNILIEAPLSELTLPRAGLASWLDASP
jgi:hypothetical protein